MLDCEKILKGEYMFNWKSDEGKSIVEYVNGLRAEGLRNWNRIAVRVNDYFNIDFHSDKIRKSWREYGEKDSFVKLDESSATFKIEYNTGEASAKGSTIKTLDDLIKACEINLDIWKIDRHTINKWEVKARDRNVFPLFQVKAWLSKCVAEETKFPVIEPVRVQMPKTNGKVNRPKGLKKALIIPDAQIGFRKDVYSGRLEPFHDRKALDLAVQIAEYIKPDRIILLGDMLDLPDWSDKFLRSPDFYWTTQPSLIETSWWIARLIKAVSDVKIDYIEGNHEDRMKKMLINHLIAAYDLKPANDMDAQPAMSIQNLLGLDDMGVTYWNNYPRDEVWITPNLRCRHGNIARKGGGSTSKSILRDTFVSEIYGHSHRFEYSCKTVKTVKGMETFRIFSPGTVAKIDGSVPSGSSEEDWQQGVGVVYYDEVDFNIVPVSINNGRCIFDDCVFVGEEYINELNKDTGWKF
jgi:hypothetical protein